MIHLFIGDFYYPSSGLGNYQGPHASLEAAEAFLYERGDKGNDWAVALQEQDGRLVELMWWRVKDRHPLTWRRDPGMGR